MTKKSLFLFVFLIFLPQTAFPLSPQRPVIWEVKETHREFIKIINKSYTEKILQADSDTKFFRAEKRTIADLKQGRFVSILGGMNPGQELRALVINLLPGNSLPGKPASRHAQNTVIGKITNTSPLEIQSTSNLTTIVNLTPRTRIIEETPVSFQEIMVGSKLRIMPDKIIILPSIEITAHKPNPNFMGAKTHRTDITNHNTTGPQNNTPKERQMPIAPPAARSWFDKTIVQQRLNSVFGFKDPNILKPDVFSWNTNYAETMNKLGGYWMEPSAIWGFHWNLIQKRMPDGSLGKYNWERHDQMIKNAQAQNIQISAKIHASIPTAKLKSRLKRTPSLPADIKAYISFVAAVVERYDGDGKDDMPGLLYPVKNWKIEDEPIYPKFFNGTGKDYAKLLRYAYNAIKSADPGANVICAMIYSVKGPLADRDPNLFLSQFYQQLKESGNSPPYDIIDHHFISLNADIPLRERFHRLKNELDLIRKSAKKAGFRTVPFESLEIAVPYSDEKTQAEDLVKHHVFALSLGMKKLLWSGIKASSASSALTPRKGESDPFRKNAIIHADSTRKLAYYSYKKMVESLDVNDLSQVETLIDENDKYVFEIRRKDHYTWVVWDEGTGNSKILINIPKGVSKVRLTESVLKAVNGKNILNDKYEFKQSQLNVINNQITITANRTPIYIETY